MKPADVEDIYTLSPIQEGMLFHSLEAPESGVYIEQLFFAFQGEMDVPAFEQAWQRVVDRHPALRTAFHWESVDKPLQVVHRRVALPVERLDWRGLPPDEQARRLQEHMTADRRRGFDLGRAPLMRLSLIRAADDLYQVTWRFHHLIMDGWSFTLVLQDFLAFYKSIYHGRTPALAPSRPFRDYLSWLKAQDLAASEAYWRRTLRGIETPTPLGVDRPRTAARREPAQYGRRQIGLSALSGPLQALGQRHQLTLNTLILGSWALLLSRYSGQEEVLFGTTTAGRPPSLPGGELIVGPLIATLPARVRAPGGGELLPWLEALQRQQLELREHEHTPLTQVHSWSDVPLDLPLFETIVVFENVPLPRSALEEEGLELLAAHFDGRPHYPITIVVLPGAELPVRAIYDRRRFDDDVIERLLGHFQTLAAGILAHPRGRIGDLSLLSDGERTQILLEWNDTGRKVPSDVPLSRLFEAQLARAPDSTAVVSAGRSLTYGQLDRRANRLARRLAREGVGPDVLVALLAPRGIDFLTAVLAVFKAGGAYLPLDPHHPAERCREILESSGAPVALMATETAPLLGRSLEAMPDPRRPRLLELEPLLAGQGGEGRLPDRAAPDHLAYVIYTSGSTGAPKGAMVARRGMVNHLWAKIVELGLGPSDIVAQNAPQIFDISVWQLLAALLVGGRVAIFEDAVARDPARLIAETEAQGVSVLEVVPSVLREMLGELEGRGAARPALARLRWLIATGEALPPDLARRWLALYGHVSILNAYGPTECSDDVTHHRVDLVPVPEAAGVPLGRPVLNTRIYLLDRALRPVPAGLPGELCVGGDGLGRGYLGAPAASADAFVPDPFASEPGSRLYRTGDLSRRRSDGVLEFLGRMDHQVKIRGFRLELGEIEAALARHPAVGEAVVVAREDPSGDRRLAAYWVAAATPAPSSSELRAFLAAGLPDYALPSAFVELAGMPRTATGKTDRRALPAPAPLRAPSHEDDFAPPGSPVREILAQAWCELFRLQQVDPRDNFFELGGHSLMITRLLSRIRSVLKVDLPVQTFFHNQTVAELAAAIEAAQAGREEAEEVPLVPVPRGDGLPLSISQERLWLEDARDPTNPLLKTYQTLRLRGRIDVAALEAGIQLLLRRHEILRTGFAAVAGRPRPVPAADPALCLPVIDLEALPTAERERQFQQISLRALQEPFDLARPPLLKAWLLRLSADDHLMLALAHRIAGDDWSMGLLIREVGAVYRALGAGRTPALAELPVQYADFAAWQRLRLRGRMLDAHLAHWRERLPRASADGLLGGRGASRRGRWASRHALPLPEPLAEALTSLARQERATLFMVQAAVLQTLLHLGSRQPAVSLGFPILNRRRKETEGMIGNFGNLLGLTSDFSGDPPFREVLARVREETLGAYAHQEVPLVLLAETLQPERDLDRQPFFSVLFLQHETFAPEDLELPELTVSSARINTVPAEADLTVELWALPTEHRNDFLYRPDVLAAAEVGAMAQRFRSLLQAVTADPARRISALAAT